VSTLSCQPGGRRCISVRVRSAVREDFHPAKFEVFRCGVLDTRVHVVYVSYGFLGATSCMAGVRQGCQGTVRTGCSRSLLVPRRGGVFAREVRASSRKQRTCSDVTSDTLDGITPPWRMLLDLGPGLPVFGTISSGALF
jgi:hypothetical protein